MKQETSIQTLQKHDYKKYYEQWQANKLDKLDEMERFLRETHYKN